MGLDESGGNVLQSEIECGFPDRRKLASGGVKYDEGKLRTDLVPPESIKWIAKVFTFGSIKYDDNNWRNGMKFSRVYGAAQRHLLAWYEGEDNDPETGYCHLWHAAWGCITLGYYMLYYKLYCKFDDRWKNGSKNNTST